jgi:acid phosphatase (class A)
MRPALLALVLVLSPTFAGAQEPKGYLGGGPALDGTRFLPPPPAPGSAAEAADLAYYHEAAKLAGSPRWAQARSDDDWSVKATLRNYRCALGLELTAETAPALSRLLQRVGADAFAASDKPKAHFKRRRPFLADATDTPLCIDIPPERRASASYTYPSGHGVFGAVQGLVLAEVSPENVDAVMRRTETFLESRKLCRVHYASDVEAGRTLGAAVFGVLHARPEYVADVTVAREEIRAARARGTAAPKDCPTA